MRTISILAILKRVWVPLVVAAAAALGFIAVVNFRGAFGSDEIFRWDGSASAPIDSINIKQVTYEVFGSGAVGSVSFLDEHAQPQRAEFTTLPWTHTMSSNNPAVIANLVAQSDGSSLGCRISVNGTVLDEQVSTGHHAQTFCLVKAA